MSNDSPPLLSAEMARKVMGEMVCNAPEDLDGHWLRKEALDALASGKTECRPAGAVPADEIVDAANALLAVVSWHTFPEETKRLYNALRGRVVGAAAPDELLELQAFILDEREGRKRGGDGSWVAAYDTVLNRLAVLVTRRQQTDAALTSAAPPPVVPQVQELRERLAAANGSHDPAVVCKWLLDIATDAIAALGAAQRPDMAVGCAGLPSEGSARASLSDTVPSTEEKP